MCSEYTSIKYRIKSVDCDVNNELLLNNLFGYMQEIAGISAEETGLGLDKLNQNGCCWIIIDTTIEILRLPKWKETIEIRTWNVGFNKFICDREYEIVDDSGIIIAKATSSWIIADVNNHRPILLKHRPELGEGIVQSKRKVFGEKTFKRYKPEKNFKENATSIICKYADYSELDHNFHVNNTRYLAWFTDAAHKIGHNVKDFDKITVNYLSEVKEGQKVDIYMRYSDSKYTFVGFKEDVPAFVVETKLK